MIKFANIPTVLRERPQWVLWRTIVRNGLPTKVPFTVDGAPAKANDPQTWTAFDNVVAAFNNGGYDGIGYEFSKDDPFVGIDLDGCRHEQSGEVAEWARTFVNVFATYAEVSPSQSGIKLFGIGKLPFAHGRKKEMPHIPICENKLPAVEVYEHSRYFAVTGQRLKGFPTEPQPCGEALSGLCETLWPATSAASDFYTPNAVVDRARKYLAKCPPAVSGQSGHNATFKVACILVLGFQLEQTQALELLRGWNQTCQPPWTDRELEHKVADALKQPGERGYLRNANPREWSQVKVPEYLVPQPKQLTTLTEAAAAYITRLRAGGSLLVATGLPNLDAAIGGGLEVGEMVIVAARPSHGKSAVALQCAHAWTAAGFPVLFVTEEMSAAALGKRALLFATDTPQERWQSSLSDLEMDLRQFAEERANCYIVESCGTTANVVAAIEQAVREHDIKCAIIDYAQLLTSPGGSRYEQITNTSIALRKVASDQKIILLVLCQLNREIEARPSFQPKLSDLRDTGQLEQDADVIVFLVWPHRIDPQRDPHKYKFYVAKNRNREIVTPIVECHFEPARQMLLEKTVRDSDNYRPEFEQYDPAWN